jgi:hypothetical protein
VTGVQTCALPICAHESIVPGADRRKVQIRRGRGAVEKNSGGAWECSAIVRADESAPRESLKAVTTADTKDKYGTPCVSDGRMKVAWVAGMDLQQS